MCMWSSAPRRRGDEKWSRGPRGWTGSGMSLMDHNFTTVASDCSSLQDIWRDTYTWLHSRTACGEKGDEFTYMPSLYPSSQWVKPFPWNEFSHTYKLPWQSLVSCAEKARALCFGCSLPSSVDGVMWGIFPLRPDASFMMWKLKRC